MTTRDTIRSLEARLNELSADRAQQVRILTHAQALAAADERALALLSIAKRRVIRKMQEER